MLYYIIPPLIIIIGLAILLSFLFKKISKIPPAELAGGGGSRQGGLSNFGKGLIKFFSQLSLKALEKITQRFKLFSLKFHNASQKWFQSIRKRRERSAAERAGGFPGKEKKASGITEKQELVSRIGGVRQKEIKSYPIISRKIVHPESRAAVKDRLEEALIERIAANPKDIEAYERLGDYYMERKNFEEALECFKQVLRLSPVHYKAKIAVRRLEKVLGR